jgi:hypothetical protein
MTRVVLVVLSLSTFASAAFAQSDDMRALRHAETAQTWIGVRGGVSISNESVNSVLDASTSSITAFQGGLQVDQWFNDMFAISAAATLNKKGINESYPGHSLQHPSVQGDDDYTSAYLEIPIVLRAAFGSGDARPYVFAGPSIGLLMSADEKVSDTSLKLSATDIKSAMNSTDFSLFLGAGFLDKLSEHIEFTVDVGYAVGLTKVYKDALPDRTTTDKSGATVSLINNSDAKSGDFRAAVSLLFGF